MQPLQPMTPFTKPKDLGSTCPPKTFFYPRSAAVQPSEALQMIMDLLSELQPNLSEQSQRNLKLLAKQLVSDVCDYCNRLDFPQALIYSVTNLLNNYLQRTQVDEETGTSLPLKKIKQDDTEFEFAVDNVDLNAWLSGIDISPIKAQLNLYRMIRAW